MERVRSQLFLTGVVCVVTILACSSAQAVAFQDGDVFAAVGSGQVQHYDSSLNLLETLNTTRGGFTTGMAFDQAGNLYVTSFSDGSIAKFDSNGNLVDATYVSGISAAPESIVFDAAGNMYVGCADGTEDVRKYDSSGNLLATFDVAIEDRGSDWIDLSADGNTLYYTSEGYKVMTYDLVADTQGADFATLANRPAFALRLLPTGGLLVADSASIVRLDAAGALVQSYDVAGHDDWFALNLDPNGTSFWSGDYGTGQFHEFDIASGALLASQNTGSSDLFGLTVFGEITVVDPVPEGGATLMLSVLMCSGLFALRGRRR